MTDTSAKPGKLAPTPHARPYEFSSHSSYAFIRFCFGAILVPHGIQKVIGSGIGVTAEAIAGPGGPPMPMASAYLAAAVQILGGICLALGFFTRAAALAVWLLMSASIVFVHWRNGYFWTSGGIEFPLLSWLMCIAFFVHGGGRHSLDRARRGEP